MTLSSTLGPVRTTVPRITSAPNVTSTYSSLLKTVRDAGLLRRTRGYYIAVMAALTVALAGCVTGFILLGDTWYQLLIAGALGIILGIVLIARKRSTVSTTRTGVDPVNGDRVQRSVRSDDTI